MAVKWRILSVNPADAVEAPKPAKKKVHPLDETETVRLLAAAKGTAWHLPLLLAVTDRPRVVTLPAVAVEALRRHRRERAAARLAAGPAYRDHGRPVHARAGRHGCRGRREARRGTPEGGDRGVGGPVLRNCSGSCLPGAKRACSRTSVRTRASTDRETFSDSAQRLIRSAVVSTRTSGARAPRTRRALRSSVATAARRCTASAQAMASPSSRSAAKPMKLAASASVSAAGPQGARP